MPRQSQNGCKMSRMYLTPPSIYGGIYLQTTQYPSVFNFNLSINSGFLSSATLQSQEQYNKIYLFAASPFSKVGGCNSGGLSSCYYIFGSNCCSQCCLNGFNCGVYCNNENLNDGCCAK
jgi:hypothetical protein